VNGLVGAVTFLTRVPVRARRPPDLTAAVPWFPVVGALVGATVGGIAAGLWHVVPPLVAAAAAVLAGVLVTGAFHEDGLADTADAFAGGWEAGERIRILDDPLHGSYGVAALCGSILLRVVALGSLASPWAMFAGAVAAHALGRGAAVAMMGTVRVARPQGLGADYARSLSPRRAAAGAAVGAAIATACLGWTVLPALGAALLAAGAMGWLTLRKIGGVTGDVLGATEQVVECLVLVVASSAVR